MRTGMAAFIGLLLVGGSSAAADDILDQIEAGKGYYADGDHVAAITEFEFALNALRTELATMLMATMPPSPVLWSAEEPALDNGAAVFGGGMMISRTYQEQKGGGTILAELMLDSPMVQAFSAVLNNPIMISAEPRVERIKMGRTNALLTWNPDDRSGEISVTLGGRVLAKLEGQDLSDKSILIDLMERWDLDAVKKAARL